MITSAIFLYCLPWQNPWQLLTVEVNFEGCKLMNILRHNKNLLTLTEWLQWTQSNELEECCVSKICGKLLANII